MEISSEDPASPGIQRPRISAARIALPLHLP